jgi:hypothetical protein
MAPLKFDEGYRTNDEARHVATEIRSEKNEALNLMAW